jgi:pilus assembly protein CpaB
MLLGVLLLVAVIVIGYLYLSGGLGIGGPAEPTPKPTAFGAPTAVPMIQIVVANQPIPINTILTADLIEQYFELKQVPRDEVTMENPVFTPEQLRDKVTVTSLEPNVPLRRSQFMGVSLSHRIPQGKRAVTLVLEEWAYGFIDLGIVRGDFVDVIVSGPIQLNFPQPYPPCEQREGLEGLEVVEAMPCPPLSPVALLSVKTVLQDIEVLDVISITETVVEEPPTPEEAEATTEGEGPPPTPTPSPPTGWIIILAVTDQQAEVVDFALGEGMGVDFLVRARGDHSLETTTGITTWILIDTYGVPVPRLIPYEIQPGDVPEGIIP